MSRKAKTKLLPIPLKNVNIKGGFWEPRVRINREVTLPIEYEQCQKTGRLAKFFIIRITREYLKR